MYWSVTLFAIHHNVLFDSLAEQLEKEWHAMQAARLTDTRDGVHSFVVATSDFAAPTKGPEKGFTISSSSSSSSSSSDASSALCSSTSAIQSGSIAAAANIQQMQMLLPSLKIPRMFWEKENVAPLQDASVGQSRSIKQPGRLSLKGRKNMKVSSNDVVGGVVSAAVCRPGVLTTVDDILETAVVESIAVISDQVMVVDDPDSGIRIEEDLVQRYLIDHLDAMIVSRFSSTTELWALGF
jgi:hypothetical protein